MMNGYEKHDFGEEPEPNGFVRAFDAFRKAPAPAPSLLLPHPRGHVADLGHPGAAV